MMTGANVYLLRLNKNLRNPPTSTARPPILPAGKEIKNISGIEFDNKQVSLSTFGAKATVLMVYSPTCPYCELNWPNWSSLVKSTKEKNINFVVVDLTGRATPDFVAKKNISQLHIFHRMDPKQIVELNLLLTPETILIGSDSKVRKAWSGVLSKQDLIDLNRMLL